MVLIFFRMKMKMKSTENVELVLVFELNLWIQDRNSE